MKQNNTNLFGQLLLWQKLVILSVITIILVVLPFSFYFITAQEDIETAQQELDGIKPTSSLIKIIKLTQQHRGLSAIVLGGDTYSAAVREAKAQEVNKEIAIMDALIKSMVTDEPIIKAWASTNLQWQAVLDQVGSNKITAPEAIKIQSDLIARYFVLMDAIADVFQLSLDPEANSYFMMRSALYALPQYSESLAKLRGMGSGILAGQKQDPVQIAILASIVSVAKAYQLEAAGQLQKTIDFIPNVKAKLQSPLQAVLKAADNVINLTESEIINKPSLSYDSKKYFDTYTTVIDSVFDLNDTSITLLKELIEERKNQLNAELLAISIGIFILFVIGAVISYYISASITRPVSYLMDVMQRLAKGETGVRSKLEGFDEIGVLGRQFDMMVDEREIVNERIQKENETLNNSIIELLFAVAKLSQRDLTAKAIVAEDVTGPVADALNLLADETSKVLNKVLQIANDVSKVSEQVQSQAAIVINVAAEEKREVEQASIELFEASKAMTDIAELAFSCNEAAQKAIANTDKAQESVTDTVQGITTIRDTIRETEKRIKRLGERSQEIGGVVNLINEISERTHILALNASMHAASAGEAGRGFAVVANEVQKLAENSREATSKIAALVNNIQVETADTVITMNDAISQVVRGTDLAQQAGNEMRETRNTTAELVNLVQRIAKGSTVQSETSARLVERAKQIQNSTNQTYDQLQEQGQQTERLVALSNGLLSSVNVFTLPKAIS